MARGRAARINPAACLTLLGIADPAIGPAQIHAPSRAQDSPRRLRFSEALVDRSVAPHFTSGQIAQPHTVTECRVPRDSSAGAYLDVVGVRAEKQQIDRVRSHSHLSGPITVWTTRTRQGPDR